MSQDAPGPSHDAQQWQRCFAVRRKRLIDGSMARGVLRRMRVNGNWRYRRETEADRRKPRT